jgi:DNA-binding GntR family transcriptional regulator
MGAKRGVNLGPLDDVVRGSTLTDQVYARLRRGLLVGQWKPGEKITARQLSRKLGVSLTPAREAIIRLSNEGAIDVSETRMFSIPRMGRDRYREITTIRLFLEPMATGLAAEKMPSSLPSRLSALNEEMRDKIVTGAFDEALWLDSEFHLTLYDAAEAPVLKRIIDILWLQAGPTRNRLSHEYRRRLIGYGHHSQVIAALAQHDVEAARNSLRNDLVDGTTAILNILGD